MITESAWDELDPQNDANREKERMALRRWLAEMKENICVDQDPGSAEKDETAIAQE